MGSGLFLRRAEYSMRGERAGKPFFKEQTRIFSGGNRRMALEKKRCACLPPRKFGNSWLFAPGIPRWAATKWLLVAIVGRTGDSLVIHGHPRGVKGSNAFNVPVREEQMGAKILGLSGQKLGYFGCSHPCRHLARRIQKVPRRPEYVWRARECAKDSEAGK